MRSSPRYHVPVSYSAAWLSGFVQADVMVRKPLRGRGLCAAGPVFFISVVMMIPTEPMLGQVPSRLAQPQTSTQLHCRGNKPTVQEGFRGNLFNCNHNSSLPALNTSGSCIAQMTARKIMEGDVLLESSPTHTSSLLQLPALPDGAIALLPRR